MKKLTTYRVNVQLSFTAFVEVESTSKRAALDAVYERIDALDNHAKVDAIGNPRPSMFVPISWVEIKGRGPSENHK